MVISQAVRRVSQFALLVLIGLAFEQPLASASQRVATNAKETAGPFWAAAQIHDVLRAFRKELPGKRSALRVFLNRYRAGLEIQDSDKPENVDDYEYDYGWGRILEPTPVRGPFGEYRLFDWHEVLVEAEKTVPALVDTAIARVRLEGGVVKSVIIDWPPGDEGPTIGVFVEGTRKDGLVIADMSGNVIKVEVHD